jgi:hypothetical protein
LLENDLRLPSAIVCSIGCGLGAIVIYVAPSAIVGAFSLPFAVVEKTNVVSNVIASICLSGWGYYTTSFTKGYLLVVLCAGLVFCILVCVLEDSLRSKS